MKWTMAYIEQLEAEGKIRGHTVMNSPKSGIKKAKSVTKKPKSETEVLLLEISEPAGMRYIKQLLEAAGVAYVTEHRFHHSRKFRFDIAIPDLMVAIEYEGVYSKKSRHTTQSGYTRDADKYNLATSLGWRVFRYTASNFKEFNVDLLKQTK